MKILYLSKALVVGAYQSKMSALAARPGVEVIAAVPPSWKDERGETALEQVHEDCYQLRVVPIALNGGFHTHFFPTIGRVLDEVQPDIFHIDEEAYNFATFHAGWLARRRKLPFVFFSWQNLHRNYPPPFRWLELWAFRNTALAIAGNREARDVLFRKGYRGLVRVIPQFGVDPRLFKMDSPGKKRDGPVCIGYAGRLVQEKGLHILLQALSQLQGAEWSCMLQGSGPARPSLETLAASLGLEQRVCFAPPLSSTQMPAFYHQVDIFVLPSLTRPNWKEQFGRVLIEAMASGTVVVGSNSGEIPHVVGDAGIIVPEGDINALKEALHRLVTDAALRHELAHAGRQRVLERFTQDAIARQTLDAYEEVLRSQ
jgi:glycosyltransferase involved in cell wall biosynthesis